MKIKKIIFNFSILVNILIGIILFTPLVNYLALPLVLNQEPKKSEVIVIFASSSYSSGHLAEDTLIRIKKGLELYKQGYADKIICTGGGDYLADAKTKIADAMKKEIELYGVNSEDILVQNQSNNTYEDIKYVLEKFKNRFNFNNAIFVSSFYHTYRIARITHKFGINPIITSYSNRDYESRHWSMRLPVFRNVAREYGAICYFKIRGYI